MSHPDRRDDRQSADPPMRRSLRGGTPPPRGVATRKQADIPKPSLPRERPELPGGVLRDIKRTARAGEVEDVATAVAVATVAVQEGDLDRALELLVWARSRAPRSSAVREASGIAHYLSGSFEEAQRELLAYRRLTGRADQNHLIADSARALGREDKVPELVDEMHSAFRDGQVGADRLVEIMIVQAGMRADAGDHDGALSILDRAPLPDELGEPHSRLWYAAGDIAERMGDRARAREYFDAVTTVDDEFLDVRDRLAALE